MAAKLSIVMPVFNHPEKLKTMLDSILANTYHDWELLAVDDGSEQDTISTLEQYTQKDSRIRFIKREHLPKGAQTCRNIGQEQANGEYIVFFDSDDYVAPYCLEQRVREMEKHPNLDFMVFCNGLYSNEEFHEGVATGCFGDPIYADDVEAFCARTLPYIVWNNIYRTEALRRSGISWDETLLSLQDGDFNLQTLLADLHYDYAQTMPDYGYRIAGSGDSISKRITSDAHIYSHLYSVEKNYRTVQNKFGNKYNNALFQGVLFIYLMTFANKKQYGHALKMADIICRYSPGYGRLFLFKIKTHHFLRHLCSDALAKKITMADFMLWRRWQIWRDTYRRKKCRSRHASS